MNKRYLFGALLLASALGVSAQKQMKAPSGGKQISDQLIGIFFEDINILPTADLTHNSFKTGRSSILLPTTTVGVLVQHGAPYAQDIP